MAKLDVAETLRGEPGLGYVTFGLACALTCLSGMRMNTLDGIYPVDVSLIVRHGLGFLAAAVAVALYARAGSRPVFSASRGRVLAIALAWTAVLLCRYSTSLLIATSDVVVTLGRLLEECVGMLLVLAWAERILPRGLRATAAVVAAAFTAFAAMQLVLTFLQRVPCMVVLALLPVVSALLLWQDLRRPDSPARPATGEGPGIAFRPGAHPSLLYAGIIFAFIFVLGRITQPTLDMQSRDLWPQLAIVLGNGLAGVTLLALVNRPDFVRT